MTGFRRFLAPFLLALQILMVAGGPVLAQYCCGQRVELEAECGPASCCPELDPCCEDEGATQDAMCCEGDVELEVEFTYVGSAEEAIFPSVFDELAPPLAVRSAESSNVPSRVLESHGMHTPDLAVHSPPDARHLGVWRL